MTRPEDSSSPTSRIQGPVDPRVPRRGPFYRTSPNLVAWSQAHPLAASLAPSAGDRMIDGAFAFTGHQLLLGFKYSSPTQPDVFELARSVTGHPQGPWQLVGRPDIQVVGGTVENYEFVMALGHWRLVATSNNLDQPWLFKLAGNPARPPGGCSGPGATSSMFPLRNSTAGREFRASATSMPIGLPLQRSHPDRSLRLPALRRKHRAHPIRRVGPCGHRCGPQHRPGPLAGASRVIRALASGERTAAG